MTKKLFCIIISLVFSHGLFADTIGKYLAISQSIPQMELKADNKSQAWAHSARSILEVSDEAIAQTALEMNEYALKAGQPIFCLPRGEVLNAKKIHQILNNSAKTMQKGDLDVSVSNMAIRKLRELYPCGQQHSSAQAGFMGQRNNYQIQSVHR